MLQLDVSEAEAERAAERQATVEAELAARRHEEQQRAEEERQARIQRDRELARAEAATASGEQPTEADSPTSARLAAVSATVTPSPTGGMARETSVETPDALRGQDAAAAGVDTAANEDEAALSTVAMVPFAAPAPSASVPAASAPAASVVDK